MKKEYMAPTTEITIIETQAILTGSGSISSTDLPGFGGFGGIDDTGDLVPSSQELEDLENLLGGGLF